MIVVSFGIIVPNIVESSGMMFTDFIGKTNIADLNDKVDALI